MIINMSRWYKIIGYKAHCPIKCNDTTLYVHAVNACDALMKYHEVPTLKSLRLTPMPNIIPLSAEEVSSLETEIIKNGYSLDATRRSFYFPEWLEYQTMKRQPISQPFL